MKHVLANERNLTCWEDLSNPWQWCIEEAWQAYCMGSLPIGAVITDEAGRLLARGRNRIYEYKADGQILCGHRLAHAEMNALISIEWKQMNPRRCILYTTTEPCPLCVGAIRLTRIGTVHYASRDQGAGSIDLFDANDFMRRAGTRIGAPVSTTLENILIAMLIEFTLHKGDDNSSLLYETVAAVHPIGATLGKQLFVEGQLYGWKNENCSAPFVFNQIVLLLKHARATRETYNSGSTSLTISR
jgi:tRNA(adenine34) deaminase